MICKTIFQATLDIKTLTIAECSKFWSTLPNKDQLQTLQRTSTVFLSRKSSHNVYLESG